MERRKLATIGICLATAATAALVVFGIAVGRSRQVTSRVQHLVAHGRADLAAGQTPLALAEARAALGLRPGNAAARKLVRKAEERSALRARQADEKRARTTKKLTDSLANLARSQKLLERQVVQMREVTETLALHPRDRQARAIAQTAVAIATRDARLRAAAGEQETKRLMDSIAGISRSQLAMTGELQHLQHSLSDLQAQARSNSELVAGTEKAGREIGTLEASVRTLAQAQQQLGKQLAELQAAVGGVQKSLTAERSAAARPAESAPVVKALSPSRGKLVSESRYYLKKGNEPQAEQALLRVLQGHPDDAQASLELGQLLMANRPDDPATWKRVAVLAQVAMHDPKLAARGHALLANVARQEGDLSTAEHEYRAAIALSPGRSGYVQKLAMVLYYEGKWAEAARKLEAAIKHAKGGAVQLRYYHALSIARLGQTRAAADELAAVSTANPGLSGAERKAAALYGKLGDYTSAVRMLEMAQQNAASWRLSLETGHQELLAKMTSQAVATFRKAVGLLRADPTHTSGEEAEVLLDLARAYRAAGETTSALQSIQNGLAADPADIAAYAFEVKLYLAEGNGRGARKALQAAAANGIAVHSEPALAPLAARLSSMGS